MAGILYVAATPIGNLEDISARAVRILTEVPIIACEDTRTTGMLLKSLGIDRTGRRLIAYHDMNERRQADSLIEILLSGTDIAVVSDAGTPLISDPGYRVVSRAAETGIEVVPIPGPCAVVTALCAAGLPSDRFTFMGFVAPKSARRLRVFESLNGELGTVIFYVPARTLQKVLGEIGQVLPDSKIVIGRELTKMHEEFVRGSAAECAAAFEGRSIKGEVTLLVHFSRR